MLQSCSKAIHLKINSPFLTFILPIPCRVLALSCPDQSQESHPLFLLFPGLDSQSGIYWSLSPKQLFNFSQFLHPHCVYSNLDPHQLLLTSDPVQMISLHPVWDLAFKENNMLTSWYVHFSHIKHIQKMKNTFLYLHSSAPESKNKDIINTG